MANYYAGDPRGQERGNPLEAARAQYQGFMDLSPIAINRDHQLELIQVLRDIEVEEARLKRETVETWGSVQSSFLSAAANIHKAIGTYQMAEAQAQNARAVALRIRQGPTDLAAQQYFADLSDDTKKAYSADRQKVLNTVTTQFESGAAATERPLQAIVQNSLVGGEIDPRRLNQALSEYADNNLGLATFTATVAERTMISADNPGVSAQTLAVGQDAIQSTAEQVMRHLYNEVLIEAKKQNVGVGDMPLYDMPKSFTEHYIQKKVDPALSGRVTEEQFRLAREQKEAALKYLKETDEAIQSIGIRSSDPYIKRAFQDLEDVSSYVIARPEAFGEMVGNMPSTAGISYAKELVIKELMAMQDTRHPYVKAKESMTQLPGFDKWMDAMAFPTVDAAVTYAAYHPAELSFAVKAYRKFEESDGKVSYPASGVTDGLNLDNARDFRRLLEAEGETQGIGFRTTRIGRAAEPIIGRRRLFSRRERGDTTPAYNLNTNGEIERALALEDDSLADEQLTAAEVGREIDTPPADAQPPVQQPVVQQAPPQQAPLSAAEQAAAELDAYDQQAYDQQSMQDLGTQTADYFEQQLDAIDRQAPLTSPVAPVAPVAPGAAPAAAPVEQPQVQQPMQPAFRTTAPYANNYLTDPAYAQGRLGYGQAMGQAAAEATDLARGAAGVARTVLPSGRPDVAPELASFSTQELNRQLQQLSGSQDYFSPDLSAPLQGQQRQAIEQELRRRENVRDPYMSMGIYQP